MQGKADQRPCRSCYDGWQFGRVVCAYYGVVSSRMVSPCAHLFRYLYNQQWPWNPETPHGAWGFHDNIVPNSSRKPLRIWMEVGDQDLFNPNIMRDNMHDWVLANENMAKALAAKGYPYQFVFARNAKHVDYKVKMQTLPEALEWLWKDYLPAKVRQ